MIADVKSQQAAGNDVYCRHSKTEVDTCLSLSEELLRNADSRYMEIADVTASVAEVKRTSPSSVSTMIQCTQCVDQFECRQELFQHVRLAHQQHAHSAKRTFKCDQCAKSFKTMVRHIY